MKLFFAGNSQYWSPWDYITDHAHCLQSYTYNAFEAKWRHKKLMEKAKQTGKVNLFLDSGAYSAYSQGVEIKIEDYIAFIKEHQQYLEVYANLDVIGDAEATLQNQKIMEKEGLAPLPCFHYGEDIKYLKYYLERYEYIALGGMVPISTPDLILWLDDIFHSYICDKNTGLPKVKIHGFGLTSFSLMKRYPWYSVDSTSWVVTGRMGAVYVPRYRQGKWIYTEDSFKVAVSTRSPSKKEAGQHIDTFSPAEKKIIFDYFAHKGYVLGKSEFKKEAEDYELKENERWNGKASGGFREVEIIVLSGLSNDYMKRDELNIMYFIDLEKSMPTWPWAFKIQESRKGFSL